MLPESKCSIRHCKYYKGVRTINGVEVHRCSAFRDGIPDEINYEDNDHSIPLPEQIDKRLVFMEGTDPRVIEPYSVSEMLAPRLHGRDNLCSTIRDIYVRTTDEDIKLWCRIAMQMSKHMYVALQTYKQMLIDKGVDIKARREDWQLKGSIGRIRNESKETNFSEVQD